METSHAAPTVNSAAPQASSHENLHDSLAHLLAKDLFFIGAHPKSGTTWLQVMLNAHPEISCSGEGHFINRFAPLLEKALHTHNAYITQKNGSVFHEFQPFPTFDKDHFAYLLTTSMALLLLRANDSRARVVGEKTPDNVLHFPLLSVLFPRARFLQVVRDGRDCAVSAWFHNQRVNPAELQRRFQGIGHFASNIARSWQQYLEHGMRFAAAQPERCVTVQYEAMLVHPVETMQAVLRFLGADASPGVVQHCVEAGAFERLSGGRPAGMEDRSSFLRRGTAGSWRDHLSPQDNQAFTAIAGTLLARLGYTVEPAG